MTVAKESRARKRRNYAIYRLLFSFWILAIFLLSRCSYNLFYFSLRYNLVIRSKTKCVVEFVCKVGSCVLGDISFTGGYQHVHFFQFNKIWQKNTGFSRPEEILELYNCQTTASLWNALIFFILSFRKLVWRYFSITYK